MSSDTGTLASDNANVRKEACVTLAAASIHTSSDVANILGGTVSGCVLVLFFVEATRAGRRGLKKRNVRFVGRWKAPAAGATAKPALADIADSAALPEQIEEGSPVRIVLWAERWWRVLLVVLGCWVAVNIGLHPPRRTPTRGFDPYYTPVDFMHRLPDPAVAGYFAVVSLVSIWLVYRACRVEARFDDTGVTIRNLFRTRQFRWPEVNRFADGRGRTWTGDDAGTVYWAAAIVLHDGRRVLIKVTRGGKSANPETLATIRQIAARYGIPEQLTGNI